tara:strand:- start:1723 stop:3903 length:2181 start_codon:yes stop_codon:yes gene_type:complete
MPSLADSGAYLDQLYQEKFGRVPDAAGKAYWKAELDSGKTSAAKIAQIFDNTDEAKQVKASRTQEAKDFLERTYKEELGRDADQAGKDYWTNEITSGRQSQADVLDNIRRSDEFQEQQETEVDEWQQTYDNELNSATNNLNSSNTASASSTNDAQSGPEYSLPYIPPDSEQGKREAINDIYRDVLERNTDESGEDYWYEELESGRQTLDDIRSNVEKSDEASNLESNKAFIEEQYQSGLDRGTRDNIDDNADPYGGGMGYWLKDLASGQTREQVSANIRRSDEFSTQAEDYLDGLYENILDRDPDDEGIAYWKEQLVSGNQTREDVEANINRSDEKWLGDTYKTELGRNLGEEGREYWLDDINERGQTREQVLANIRRSEEYLNRGTETCPTGQHLENGICVNDAVTECPEGQRIENGQCVDDITICNMMACPEGQTKNEDCECVDEGDIPEEEVCPVGTRRNAAGNCETDPNTLPQECPEGYVWDGSQCRATGLEERCPMGQTRNAAGQCVPEVIGEEEEDEDPMQCPTGYQRNSAGACVENAGTYMGEDPTQGGDIGTYMGEDPTETLKGEDDETMNPLSTTKAIGTGTGRDYGSEVGDMGYRSTNREYQDLYNASLRDMSSLNDLGEEDRVRYGELQSRYGTLKADYEAARREADSYIDAQREDETSRLRSGITIGGSPGSRRTDIRSGNTAVSDRSRRRSVSARSNRDRDRSPSMQGIRSGF